jgi:tetratricopeptide (TPR) repeat protein
MEAAWATRRAALDAPPAEQQRMLERAKADLVRAVESTDSDDAPTTLARALHLLANVELDLGAASRAQALWERSVDILRDEGEPLQLAHKVRHLGDVHRHRGHLEHARACYAEALALHREHDASGSLDFANAASRMAALLEACGEREHALAQWQETRMLLAGLDLTAGVNQAERHIRRLEA